MTYNIIVIYNYFGSNRLCGLSTWKGLCPGICNSFLISVFILFNRNIAESVTWVCVCVLYRVVQKKFMNWSGEKVFCTNFALYFQWIDQIYLLNHLCWALASLTHLYSNSLRSNYPTHRLHKTQITVTFFLLILKTYLQENNCLYI